MYSINQLVKEIRSVIDCRMSRKEPIHPDWVTQEIISSHQGVDGEDSDFYLCVGRETIRSQVRKQINRFALSPEKAIETDRQLVLPGYERLQAFYLVDIGGEQVAVPIERMTRPQRKAKATELRAMGDGCYQHADEMERYDAEHPSVAA